jgi:hypothetical protein
MGRFQSWHAFKFSIRYETSPFGEGMTADPPRHCQLVSLLLVVMPPREMRSGKKGGNEKTAGERREG